MRKKYEKYKDSGIEWIGEVPEHWEEFKTKQLFRILGGNGFTESSQGRKNGDYPFYKVSDINFGNTVLESAANYVDKEDIVRNCWNVIPAKSVLMAKIGEALRKNHRKVNVSECLIDNNMLALVPNNKIHLWLVYYFFNIIDMEWFVNPGAVPSVNIRWFKNSNLFIMPKPEQAHIINFLNAKTSEIDSLIADKEKLIQRLQEYKQSVITEAVTKGLNPDVKMKDSGIEWIGEVPEHWEVKRLKDFAQVSRGTIDKNVKEDEIPVYLVPYTSIYSKREQRESDDDYLLISVTKNELNNSKVIKGDILLTASSETPDDIGRSTVIYDQLSNHVFGSDILRIRIPEQIMVLNYRKYLMENHIYLNKFNSLCRGVTRFRFGMNDFKTIRYPLPPIQEQEIIAGYLDKIANDINSIVEDTRKQIDLLKEYRQSLIYEAVTGKIDVRDYKPENYKLERSDHFA